VLEAVDKLKHFTAPNRLKTEAMKVLLRYIPQTDYQALQELFEDLDVNKDGFITGNDIRAVLTKLGHKIAAKDIKRIMQNVDFSRHCKIDYSEFLMATMDFKKALTDQMLHDIFTYFDSSNHGCIDVGDL
jgi:calcium-dependent protein kinase